MDDLVRCFVDEAHDNLVAFSDAVLRLEQDPSASAVVDDMFRNVHTIKGAAGFLAFAGIEEVAHAAESVLAQVRSGRLPVTRPLASLLLAAVDALAEHVADVRTDGAETSRDHSDLLAALDAVRPHAQPDDLAATPSGAAPAAAPVPDEPPAPVSLGTGSVRVSAETVDQLMRLVGELVTARNSLSRLAAHSGDVGLVRCARDVSRVAEGLRDGVRVARTQRVGEVWQGLPRLVRDTAVRSGKLARLTTDGADLEFDRDVLDAVRDPLVHMVRNAVDHGVETPDRRRELGKAPEGTVTLRAVRTAGHVVIELADDGRGIDPAAVAARAVELGVLSRSEADLMDPADIVRLVMHAGLSTSDSVTQVSGRGVGMDVVRRNVEQVGGTLDIVSVPGAGTTISLRLPMSLGITHVLTLAVAGRRYAVPYGQVVDLVRLEADDAASRVDLTRDGAVLRWRGGVVPVVDLRDLLADDIGDSAGEGAGEVAVAVPEAVHIAVLQVGAHGIAVRADRFVDTEEVVARPLGRRFENVPLYVGAGVLADGSVALVLDAVGVAAAARRETVALAVDEQAVARPGSAETADDAVPIELLTVDVGAGRLAVPLELVVRVLEIESSCVESVGSWEVARLDDTVLPLVRVRPSLGGPEPSWQPGRGVIPVVVVRTEEGGEVGIAVDGVDDIVTAPTATSLDETGLVGVAVVRDRIAGQLDVRAAVAECLSSLDSPIDAMSA